MLTQDFARRTFPGRAKKFRNAQNSFEAARESFTSCVKFDTSVLILRENVSQTAQKSDKIVQTEIILRETKIISHESTDQFVDSNQF